MKSNFRIFYSWQSDIQNKHNRSLIQTAIERAVKAVTKEERNFKLEVNIDRDTEGANGSPNISATIFDKIRVADIFICDVSIINNNLFNRFFKKRLSPNPNVLIELGYAINLLGWERVICINNEKFGKVEELPFDIRGHRILKYISDKDIPKEREQLKKALADAISSIVSNYNEVVEKHNIKGYIKHDLEVYEQINLICNEEQLLESISTVVNYLFINDFYYRKWDALGEYFKNSGNHFIDDELTKSFKDFLEKLNKLEELCATKFFPLREQPIYENGSNVDEESELRHYRYGPVKTPFNGESWGDKDRRIQKLQEDLYGLADNVKISYAGFISLVKKKLLSHR